MNNRQFRSHVIHSLDEIKIRLDSIDTRLDSIDTRLDSLEKSFIIINNLLGRLQEKVDESLRLYSQFTSDFRKRLEKLENRFS